MLVFLQAGAQEKKPTLWKRITGNKHLTRIDSVLSTRYFRMGKMDTAYITRPGGPRYSTSPTSATRRTWP